MTSRFLYATLFVAVLGCLVGAGTDAAGATSAVVVSSPAQHLTGGQADGQNGDILLENGEIAVVISAIGHVTGSGANGGTVIDAGLTASRVDALGEFYTYFDDDWPRQAVYTSLVISDNGSTGGPAVVRATGQDSQDASLTVVTDYVLADGASHLEIITELTASGAAHPQFELGDAFDWGDCSKYAPGYGYSVGGTTSQPWIAGVAPTVSYAYGGIYGENWGPHGGYWSDLSVVTEDIATGETVSYTRHLAVAAGEIAAAVSVLYEALGTPVGSLICNVASAETGAPLVGGWIDVRDAFDLPFLEATVNGTGQAFAELPPGTWRVESGATGFIPDEAQLTVYDGAVHGLDFLLSPGGGPSTAIGDTLTVIQKPLVNVPALRTPGEVLQISCVAGPATSGWQAELMRGGLVVPLAPLSASYDPSTEWWTLSATVPTVPLHGLWDLRVTADGGVDDTARQAVQILQEYRDDWYFIQISDSHLPDHQFSDSGAVPADSTEIVDLREVIADINLINPEFVLITGDFVNEGELEDYLEWRSYTRAQRMLYEFEVPTFLIAGNHDIGGWNATPPPAGTARRNWWRFFGWPRLDDPPPGAPLHTQNYSFDYGPVHFAGLESYDNYDLWRSEIYGNDSFPAEQTAWLDQDLAVAAGSTSQVLFYHFDFQNELNLNALGVEMALWGHVHGDRGNLATQPWDLATNNTSDGERSYRVIRVSDGILQPEATVSAGGAGENLAVSWAPANNGLASTVTATVVNDQPLSFANGRLRFVMPAAGGNYLATGGTLVQVDQSGPYDICHVALDIPAAGSAEVTVSYALSDVPGRPDGVLALKGNQPNPFNPVTEIRYEVPREGRIVLDVYDLRGRLVAELINRVEAAGEHRVIWRGRDRSGRDMPSGTYFVRLASRDESRTMKILLAR